MTRRTLLAAGASLGMTALSYGRVAGANDRISMAHVGVGNRGRELASVVADLKERHNVEMTAVCDLWSVNRERAAKAASQAYGRAPRSFQYVEDLLALKDVDAIIISTADFQHAPLLNLAAEAGKDAYCEKPMANVLEEAKAARDAVRSHKRVVQIGTQHRSEPYQTGRAGFDRGRRAGTREQSGDRVELPRSALARPARSKADPRGGYGLAEMAAHQALPAVRSARLFRVPPLPRVLERHPRSVDELTPSDMVHYLLDDHFPTSAVAQGGVYAWPDGRENPDTFQALLEYPKGFLVSYSTSFGNDSDSFTRIMGDKATLINIGGEGSQRWKLVEEKGTHEANPFVHRSEKYIKLSGEKRRSMSWSQRVLNGAIEKTYGPLPFISDSNPCHMRTGWNACAVASSRTPRRTMASPIRWWRSWPPGRSVKATSCTGIRRPSRFWIIPRLDATRPDHAEKVGQGRRHRTRIAVDCADFERHPPVAEHHTVRFRQAHGRIVNVSGLRGDSVQLEYIEAPRLKILDCRRADVETAKVESLVRLGDGLDRAA